MFKTISAITIALTGACLAQPEAKPFGPGGLDRAEQRQERREHRREAVRDRVHDRFDADGDGQLSDSKRETARAAFRERREAHKTRVLDRIQDKSFADMPEPIALALSEFDMDDSLSIDDDERVLLELEIDARVEAKKAEMLARFDSDGDGQLSKDERDSAREAKRAEREQRRADLLNTYDADDDGKLDQSEREALRAGEGPRDRDPLLQMLRPRRGHGAHQGRGQRGPQGFRGKRRQG